MYLFNYLFIHTFIMHIISYSLATQLLPAFGHLFAMLFAAPLSCGMRRFMSKRTSSSSPLGLLLCEFVGQARGRCLPPIPCVLSDRHHKWSRKVDFCLFSQKWSARSSNYFCHDRIVRASIFHSFLVPKTVIRIFVNFVDSYYPCYGKKFHMSLSGC